MESKASSENPIQEDATEETAITTTAVTAIAIKAVDDESVPIPQPTTNSQEQQEVAFTETTTETATETTITATEITTGVENHLVAKATTVVENHLAESQLVQTADAGESKGQNDELEIKGKRKLDESASEKEDSDIPSPKIQRVDQESKEAMKVNKQEYTRWSVEPHCSVVRVSPSFDEHDCTCCCFGDKYTNEYPQPTDHIR